MKVALQGRLNQSVGLMGPDFPAQMTMRDLFYPFSIKQIHY